MAALDPGTLRYPGGTGADDFPWQAGTPDKVVDGFHLTLPVLAAACSATGAVPVFDLNIATSTLADQIAMLQQGRSLGLPVRYVELGNEVYSGFPDVKTAFPAPADYGAAVGADVAQLHAAFPGVEVGADGYLRTNPPLRDRDWNPQVLAAAVAHGGLPDALILHAYAAAPAGALASSQVPSMPSSRRSRRFHDFCTPRAYDARGSDGVCRNGPQREPKAAYEPRNSSATAVMEATPIGIASSSSWNRGVCTGLGSLQDG